MLALSLQDFPQRQSHRNPGTELFNTFFFFWLICLPYKRISFWMNEYFRLLGTETKKSWSGKGGEGRGSYGSNVVDLHYLCTLSLPRGCFPFFFSLALGVPYHNHTEKTSQQKPCLTHVWDMLYKWPHDRSMKDITPALSRRLLNCSWL